MVTSSQEREEARVSGLIAHLYDAAMDGALWRGTADRIAEAFDSTSTVLKLHGDGAQVSLLECTGNLVVSEREQAWADDWHRKDLWVERSVAHGLSRIVVSEQLVTPTEERRSGFYQEWLRHLGIHHMLGAVFPVADGAIGVLGVHRPRGAGVYTPSERRRAALVLPHLQRALRLGQRLSALSHHHAAALEALDRLDAGVLMVDGACRVIHASAMGALLLRENAEISTTGGRLRLRSPALHRRLLALVRSAMDVAHGKAAAPGTALSVPRRQRMPLVLEVAPLRPSARAFGEQRPTLLVFIRDPQAPLAAARLRDLFGLTPAEGLVAAALGRGRSPEDIAVDLGIGLVTVRSHLKRIFAKTGTHRQAEAVALLARSVSTSPQSADATGFGR
ncbi:MAG: helix-turn-helix transcriptional regulator [Comamonadaceae bacterium]|nr:helix-turn-helix transcriptional regulator [Burkholderiales bacterium]MEB2349456.1 helix-turn-helix transcriptional regulator [Comamonadaceae bacterium]